MEMTGLTSKEAKLRLDEYGKNVLPEKPPPSDLAIFASQLANPLVYVLLAAFIVTLVLKEYSDSIVILAAVLINSFLGFFQERKADRALAALKQMVHPESVVIRDGKKKSINSTDIVVGDVVVINPGDKVPADGILLKSNRLYLDESFLTGESMPVKKLSGTECFMGSIVVAGNGMLLIEKTAKDTQMGSIALSLEKDSQPTPLKKELTNFSRQLTYLVFILTFLVFVIGIIRKIEVIDLFETSVALAVASIPEGLLIGLTTVLAIGMQRILKRKGLVRKLLAAETLGGVTVICTDKTGTLTEGKMHVVDFKGDRNDLVKQMIVANDQDDPIVVAGYEWANKFVKGNDYSLKQDRIDTIPFSSHDRYFAALNKNDKDGNMVYVNGAPEYILNWSDVNAGEKQLINKEIHKLTTMGYRVVGLAQKKVQKDVSSLNKKIVESDLNWNGLLAFSDPVRRGVKEALKTTNLAGIRTVVITGDYAETAIKVMEELDIKILPGNIILGTELAKMSNMELIKKLKNLNEVMLFARTTPDLKLKIVDALKANGEVVAMMGDGVNDAPALKHADIGIVVGNATEVAKETADLILLDSSFETIVAAVREGRGMFGNMRKIVLYLMSDAFSEITAVLGSMILGLPLPITAAQILWINLVSDGFPHLALTVDKFDDSAMDKPPRARLGLLSTWMKNFIGSISVVGGIISLALFYYFLQTTNNLTYARSVAFAALGSNSLLYVFSIKTLNKPFWKTNPFDNKWLNLAVLAGILLQLAPFMFPGLRKIFEVEILSISTWLVIVASSACVLVLIEIVKPFLAKQET